MKPKKSVAIGMLIFSAVLAGLMIFAVYQGMAAVGPSENPFEKISSAANWAVETYPILWAFFPFSMIAPAIFIRHSSAL